MKALKLSAQSRWIIDSFFLPRIELGTLRVWGARDNHFTTETIGNWNNDKTETKFWRRESMQQKIWNKFMEMQVLARFQLGSLQC